MPVKSNPGIILKIFATPKSFAPLFRIRAAPKVRILEVSSPLAQSLVDLVVVHPMIGPTVGFLMFMMLPPHGMIFFQINLNLTNIILKFYHHWNMVASKTQQKVKLETGSPYSLSARPSEGDGVLNALNNAQPR
jgi:hypothetical protein